MVGTNWLVTGGLNDGDQVIATSVDKVHPGMPRQGSVPARLGGILI
ncbi:MAG: hypothetical protein WDM77_19845 [Steroidobacteraceae bacterium]